MSYNDRNNKNKNYRKNKKRKPFKHQYNVGEKVYFLADSTEEQIFYCSGYVMRQPTHYSRVYKIAVVSVGVPAKPTELQNKSANRLLGMIIPRYPNQLSKTASAGMLQTMYDNNTWINLEGRDLEKLNTSLRRKLKK